MKTLLETMMKQQEECFDLFNTEAVVNEKKILEDIQTTVLNKLKVIYNVSTDEEALKHWESFKNDKFEAIV